MREGRSTSRETETEATIETAGLRLTVKDNRQQGKRDGRWDLISRLGDFLSLMLQRKGLSRDGDVLISRC